MVLCGDPGSGKSFMLMQMAIMWYEQNIPFAIYELEDDIETYLNRALGQLTATAGFADMDWIKDNYDTVCRAHSDYAEFIEAFGASITLSPEYIPTFQGMRAWVQEQCDAGKRVICIDPITNVIASTKKKFEEESEFVGWLNFVCRKYEVTIILNHHPKNQAGGNAVPCLSALAGSASFSRFGHTVIWLEPHEMKNSQITTWAGTSEDEHNRTVHLLKTRNGCGQGRRIAFVFNHHTLMLEEKGLIVKKKKNKGGDDGE